MKKLKRNVYGITLIALVISIIIMLILAGVSIGMLTGENGLIKQTIRTKEAWIIADEIEQIEAAYVSELFPNKKTVTSGGLERELLNESKPNESVVVTRLIDGTIKVFFEKTEHNFHVDKSGNITGPVKNEVPDGKITVIISTVKGISDYESYYIERYERYLDPGTNISLNNHNLLNDLKIEYPYEFKANFLQSLLTSWERRQDVTIPQNPDSSMYWIEIWDAWWYIEDKEI